MGGCLYPLPFVVDPRSVFACFSFREIICRERGGGSCCLDLISDKEIAGYIYRFGKRDERLLITVQWLNGIDKIDVVIGGYERRFE